MKGVEGMPLKYLILILVAVIVIGAVLTIINQFAGQAQESGGELADTLGKGFNATNQNTCEAIPGCTWDTELSECSCE